VRQVLDYVVHGEADAAILYATEAALGGEEILRGPEIDAKLHDRVIHEAALVEGKGTERARAFLEFLASSAGLSILAQAGFGPPPGLP
jgi:molybdate transport system substrate-binding protein